MEPLPVTVVIPVYNRRDSFPATVASVTGQRGACAQHVIVVDDASSDGSADRAEELGSCEVVRLEVNGGSAAARNAGLARVTTAWVAFLDSDDLWHADLLATLWPHTEGNVLVSGSAFLQVDGRTVTLLGTPEQPGQALRSPADILAPANPIVTSATLVRTDVAQRLGGFDTRLRYSEDLDLWLRVLEHGTGWCDGRPVLTYFRGSGSKSQAVHGNVERARARIVGSYRPAYWWTARDSDRYLGGMYWEGVRTALRGGNRRLAWEHLRRMLRTPWRVIGAVQSVDRNRRLRRRAAALRGSYGTVPPAEA